MTSEGLTPRLIGASVTRSEDPRFLTGRGRYLGDLTLPRMVEAVFVRSPHSHARVGKIEVPAGARILTWQDMSGRVEPLTATSRVSSFRPTPFPPLASDRVRFVGEAVALVTAPSRHVAEQLAEAVDVTYDPLPAVIDTEEAIKPGAQLLHANAPNNILIERSTGDAAAVEEQLRKGAVVVRKRLRHGRLVGVPIECRGCLADFEPASGLLRLWSSTQIPHLLRTYLSQVLRMPEHRLQVIAPDVGGGFGIKSVFYPEEAAVAYAAIVLGRPVRWIEDRLEHMLASAHAREQIHYATLAVDESGHILALADDLLSDNGAYSAHPWTAGMEPLMAMGLLPGPYKVPVYHGHCRGVATNKSPHAPYRGVGRPASVFVMESLLDCAAQQLQMDPVELRRRNLIDSFPYRSVTGLIHNRASYIEALEELCGKAGYEEMREQQSRQWERGRYLGIGVSCFAELTGLGSGTAVAPGLEHRYGNESADMRMDPSGGVTVGVGIACHGQGLETTLAQVAADELGIPLESVRILHGDTGATPYGMGTYASRSAVLAGGAIIQAARDLRQKLLQIAGHLLEVAPDDLEIHGGIVSVRGSRERQVSIADIAARAHFRSDKLPPGMDAGLNVVRFFDPRFGTFANAAHLAQVEVVPATGQVKVLRYVVVDDCGVMINPMIVDGQIRGAVTQGIGEALYEEVRYDESGQLLTGSLMDYLVPTASEIPDLEIHHLVTPSEQPGGFKGVGEGGTVGAPAAVANAVRDVVSRFGADLTDLPVRPDWVWRVLQAVSVQPGPLPRPAVDPR